MMRTGIALPLLPLLLQLLVACGTKAPPPDPNAAVCDHYAQLVVKCAEDHGSNKIVLADTARDFCRKGMSGEHEELFGARYRAMIACTRTAETCEAYRACQDDSH